MRSFTLQPDLAAGDSDDGPAEGFYTLIFADDPFATSHQCLINNILIDSASQKSNGAGLAGSLVTLHPRYCFGCMLVDINQD